MPRFDSTKYGDFIETGGRVGGVTVSAALNTGVFAALMAQAQRVQYAGIVRVGGNWAKDTAQWMKEHAEWEDQTGKARRTLGVVAEYGKDFVKYTLTDGMPYMYHLEISHGGKYRVLEPATYEMGPVLLDRVGATRTA